MLAVLHVKSKLNLMAIVSMLTCANPGYANGLSVYLYIYLFIIIMCEC